MDESQSAAEADYHGLIHETNMQHSEHLSFEFVTKIAWELVLDVIHNS